LAAYGKFSTFRRFFGLQSTEIRPNVPNWIFAEGAKTKKGTVYVSGFETENQTI
jgi:hypothetical protein